MRTRTTTTLALALLGAAAVAFAAPGDHRVAPASLALVQAQAPATATPVSAPPTIVLRERHGHVTPTREGFNHTGGGIIDVAQPTPDVVFITMTGAAVAGGHPCKDSVATMHFDFDQCLEVAVADPKPGRLKIALEARAIGLLRSHAACCTGKCKGTGSAEMSEAHAALVCSTAELVAVALEPHAVAGGENLSINDHVGPVEAPIVPGKYQFRQAFTISAAHARGVFKCKAASAEFAPDPALDPLWISYWEPFHGAIKKDFGFQVLIRVVPDTSTAAAPAAEPIPAPQPAGR